jgi:hypothetical protein
MKINSDFKDLLRNLNAAGIRYLIVGGYAVMVHTEPRYTKDLDIWINRDEQNARALLSALAGFGAPIGEVTAADLTEPDVFFQIGIEPVRIDILTTVPGLDFEAAWNRRIEVDFGGETAQVLCRQDILAAKIAAGRPIDEEDARNLRQE